MKVKIKGPNVNGKIMIDRDGFPLSCPFDLEGFCGNHCPAFCYHSKSDNDPEWIELKCFPQQVRFEVENECR